MGGRDAQLCGNSVDGASVVAADDRDGDVALLELIDDILGVWTEGIGKAEGSDGSVVYGYVEDCEASGKEVFREPVSVAASGCSHLRKCLQCP